MIDPATALELSPPEAAELAQLRYVSDQQPGWRRRRCGRGFSYLNQAGERLGQAQTARLRALAIPPAWTEVWICPWPNGHIQAVGRDARGRKQYLYHPRWQQLSDETKFSRILAFGEQLPELRARIERDLGRRGVSRERILAAVVRLLETTLIRIGNREYARRDQSFGLTTLRDDHLDVRGSTLRFQFRGKSGKEHEVTLADRRLARLVKQCQELPGQELFQYLGDDGAYHALESVDVNAYLREVTGSPFTAKDFRTWGGTVAAASQLHERGRPASEGAVDREVNQAIREVARALGNTPAVCRRYYVHPAVPEAFRDGRLAERWVRRPPAGLDAAEATVLRLLRESSPASA